MLKYKCLVLDHDDTVVQSEKTLGFPYFKEFMSRIRPNVDLTFDEYVRGCNRLPFVDLCRECWQFTDEELQEEWTGWKEYLKTHIPAPYEGMDRIIHRQKKSGGLVCVVSLSGSESITRDYEAHFNMVPDIIYGWDLPKDQQKPNPYPLQDIMARYRLEPHEILVVDDGKMAWQMARAVGVPIAFAAWSKKDFPEIAADMRQLCDLTFEQTEDLEKFLFE